VEETGENRRPAASHWQSLSHYVVLSATLVVIETDCIGSYKSNYHAIRTTTAPLYWKTLFFFIFKYVS
jgi:hypothetical protein